MKEEILKRYKVRQKRLELANRAAELRRVENWLDDIITYKALVQDDPVEAKRFKRNNIDTRKDGLFKLRVKNGLKIEIPYIPKTKARK